MNSKLPISKIIGNLGIDANFDRNQADDVSARLLSRPREGGRYVVDEQVAQGGMGIVYAVIDQDLMRQSILKVVSPEWMDDPEKVHSFIEEARMIFGFSAC